MSAVAPDAPAREISLVRKLVPLLYVPVFLGWYFALEGRPASTMTVVGHPWDALIPFDERWLMGYFAWFPFLLGFVAWLFVVDARAYREIPRVAFLLITGMTVCLVAYSLWPTTQVLRPAAYPREGVLTDIVSALQGFDDPSNVFPSLHVYTSIVVAYSLATSRYVRAAWVRVGAVVLCALIAASTTFLKQHSFLDAAGALVLFGAVWGAWRLLGLRPRTAAPA